MARRNYLIEGVSGGGKTAVCTELQRRGYEAIHGDRELAYRGDPETGGPEERELAVRLHRTKEDIPATGTVIDATAPLATIVDEIVHLAGNRTAG